MKPKDIVSIDLEKILIKEEKIRIRNFYKTLYQVDASTALTYHAVLIQNIKASGNKFIIISESETPKSKVKYFCCQGQNGITVYIQARYCKEIERHSNHPRTKMFL